MEAVLTDALRAISGLNDGSELLGISPVKESNTVTAMRKSKWTFSIIFNPRRMRRRGNYSSQFVCVCVSESVTVLAATSFVH